MDNVRRIQLLFNNNNVWEKYADKVSITLPFKNKTPLFRYLLDYGDYYLEFSKIDETKEISYDISFVGKIYPKINVNIKNNSIIHENFFANKNLVYANGDAMLK
jgi:hypothetical protein